jgi:hypothetical protein
MLKINVNFNNAATQPINFSNFHESQNEGDLLRRTSHKQKL